MAIVAGVSMVVTWVRTQLIKPVVMVCPARELGDSKFKALVPRLVCTPPLLVRVRRLSRTHGVVLSMPALEVLKLAAA